jgi:hypothetical protein
VSIFRATNSGYRGARFRHCFIASVASARSSPVPLRLTP